MALRSLSGKLNGFLRARAAAASSPTAAAAAAASSMIPVKRYSTEERIRAILREQQRLQDEEVKNEIRKANIFIGVVVTSCVGVLTFAVLHTRKAIEERKRKHMVFEEKVAAIMGDDYEPISSIEDVIAYIMDELHTDMMDAKRRVAGGNVMDAKKKSKSVDA